MRKPGNWDGDDFLGLFVIAILLGAVGLGIWIVIAACRADGKIDYCYIQQEGSAVRGYVVYGHRAWRSDTVLAAEPTSDAAETKHLMMCPAK